MSTAFSRLREVFLDDREPQQALFCTYGLDADFFEAEVLPAVFPQRLALDREAGSAAGYLHAADRALQSVPVTVFYDHLLGGGNQLQYIAQRVNVAGAFHAKLILLDYGDVLRAVISSANLTRAGWTQLLEIFLVEDLEPHVPHPWAPGLSRFLARLAREIPDERRGDVEDLSGRLAMNVPPEAKSEVMSSWDGALLPQILSGVRDVQEIDVVTPFLEGDEGSGVFDQLERFQPAGRLFLAASDDGGGRYLLRGPEQKIDALLDTGRWQVLRVHQEWKGDDEDATLRTLHGKALCFGAESSTRLVVGSANATRAALLIPPPTGNVELVAVTDTDDATARGMLPQATRVARESMDIEPMGDPAGEDDLVPEGPERHVAAALYWPARSQVEVRLHADAPALVILYEGVVIGETHGACTVLSLSLRGALFLEVSEGEEVGVVPMVVAQPAQFVPRGTPMNLDLETFCLLLAGARDIAPVPGDLPSTRDGGHAWSETEVGRRGAIPWRRLLAAIHGVGTELQREAPFPRGVAFVLENETRLGGLRRRLREAHKKGRLLDADYAYVLHELSRTLTKTRDALADQPESQALISTARDDLRTELTSVVSRFDGAIAAQLQILAREVTA